MCFYFLLFYFILSPMGMKLAQIGLGVSIGQDENSNHMAPRVFRRLRIRGRWLKSLYVYGIICELVYGSCGGTSPYLEAAAALTSECTCPQG